MEKVRLALEESSFVVCLHEVLDEDGRQDDKEVGEKPDKVGEQSLRTRFELHERMASDQGEHNGKEDAHRCLDHDCSHDVLLMAVTSFDVRSDREHDRPQRGQECDAAQQGHGTDCLREPVTSELEEGDGCKNQPCQDADDSNTACSECDELIAKRVGAI